MQEKITTKICRIKDEHEFAHELAKLLKEPKLTLIKSVVKYVPREIILEVIQSTIEIQVNGGMKRAEAGPDEEMAGIETLDAGGHDKKYKTAGGVFLTILKKHPKFTQEMKKNLARVERLRHRESKRNNSMLAGLSLEKGVEISVEDMDRQLSELQSKIQQEQLVTMEMQIEKQCKQ